MSRSPIKQRKRIYLGCEGPSEQSYVVRLGQIADAAGLHLHFDNDIPRPGGDPIELVQSAIRRIKEREKHGAFAVRAILLDQDKIGLKPEWELQIKQIAAKNRLHLIWQNPCHEAFLLRHFEGQKDARPQTSHLASQALKRVWSEYHKPMVAMHLANKIDLKAVQYASSVEAAFRVFLDEIGLTCR